MMDIVERLRSYTENDAYSEPWTFGKTLNEAADEIERLREALIDMSFYITGHNWIKLKIKTTDTYDAIAALKETE